MLPLLGAGAHDGVRSDWLDGLVALGADEEESHSTRLGGQFYRLGRDPEFDAIASLRPTRRRRIDTDGPTVTTPEPSPNLNLLSNTFL